MALSQQEITNALLDSIQMIADNSNKNKNRIEKVKIIDSSNYKNGIYTVSNGSAKYTATSYANPGYVEGMQVFVLIPDGDFSNERLILERCQSLENNDLAQISQLSRCILNTTNLIETNGFIYANDNYNSDTKIWRLKVSEDHLQQMIKIYEAKNLNQNSLFQGNSYLGISGKFKTSLESLVSDGDYGILVEVVYEKDENSSAAESEQLVNYFLSAKENMIGDIYNFKTYFSQSALYELQDKIISQLTIYIYQDGQFEAMDDEIRENLSNNWSIWIKDIEVKFGQNSPADSKLDDIKIFSENGLKYDALENSDTNQKTLNLKWQYRNSENSWEYKNIKSKADINNIIGADGYHIYWYRYSSKKLDDVITKRLNMLNIYETFCKDIDEYLDYCDELDPILHGYDNAPIDITAKLKVLNNYYLSFVDLLGENSFIQENYNNIQYMWITSYGKSNINNIKSDYDNYKTPTVEEIQKITALAGDGWEWINTATDSFSCSDFIPNNSLEIDKIKVIVQYGPLDNSGNINEKSKDFRQIETPILDFINERYAYLEDNKKDLKIKVLDNSNGKYFLYNENFNIINKSDALTSRILQLVFDGVLPDKENFFSGNVTVLWKLPKSKSMLNFEGTFGGDFDEKGQKIGVQGLDRLITVHNLDVDRFYFIGKGNKFEDFYFIKRSMRTDENGNIEFGGCSHITEAEKIMTKNAETIKILDKEIAELQNTKAILSAKQEGKWRNVSVVSSGTWKKENGKWCYILNGSKVKGWQFLHWSGGNDWFYFNSQGEMLVEWQDLKWANGIDTFYFDDNGAMAIGWKKISKNGSENWYYFDLETGVLIKNTFQMVNLTFNNSGQLVEIKTQSLKEEIDSISKKIKDLETEKNKIIKDSTEAASQIISEKIEDLIKQEYFISPILDYNNTNNTVSCYVIKENKILDTYFSFDFGQKNISKTDYSFSLRLGPKVDKNFAFLAPADGALTLGETEVFHEILFDVYDFNNTKVELSLKEKNDIIKLWMDGSEEGYFSGFSKKNNLRFISLKETENNESYNSRVAVRVIKKFDGKELTILDFSGIVLKAKWNGLIQLLPIHVRKSYTVKDVTYNSHYLLGSEYIIYNEQGLNPIYCREGFKLINLNNGKEISGIIRLENEELKDSIPITETTITMNEKYSEKLPPVIGVIFQRTNAPKEDIYTFPLVILKNRFQIPLIDERENSFNTTIKDYSILNPILLSGETDNNNNFTGVVIGEIQNQNSIQAINSGLFGYNQGIPTYGFKEDGTAFIGKDSIKNDNNTLINNGGKIEFTNKGGKIISGDPDNGIVIDLATGELSSNGRFSLVGNIPNLNNLIVPENGIGSNILFKKDTSLIDIGLWYYPKEKITYPYLYVKADDNDIISFDKNQFLIKTAANINGTKINDYIDLRKGEINFNDKFKVDAIGNVYCNNLTANLKNGELGENLKVPNTSTYKPNNLKEIIETLETLQRTNITLESLGDEINDLISNKVLNANNLFINFSAHDQVFSKKLVKIIENLENRIYELENN